MTQACLEALAAQAQLSLAGPRRWGTCSFAPLPKSYQGALAQPPAPLLCTPPPTPPTPPTPVQEFNFEKLGIGGLDDQFEQIFRRAFASRVFPPSVVERLGIRHVRGVLLYGPPGEDGWWVEGCGGQGSSGSPLLRVCGMQVAHIMPVGVLVSARLVAGQKMAWLLALFALDVCTVFSFTAACLHRCLPCSHVLRRHGQDPDRAADRQDAQRQGAQDCERPRGGPIDGPSRLATAAAVLCRLDPHVRLARLAPCNWVPAQLLQALPAHPRVPGLPALFSTCRF